MQKTKQVDKETLEKLQNSEITKIVTQEINNIELGKNSKLKEEFLDSGEIDWKLVESFKRALEDLKAGRVEEV